MKKKILLIIIIFLICFVLCFILNVKHKNHIDIKDDNKLWYIYDINIQTIEQNISTIADPNDTFEWYKLKNLNTEDTNYQKYLNSLLVNVRQCYIDLENPNNIYTTPNLLKKYRNKNELSLDELNILKDKHSFSNIKNSCIDNFLIYKDLKLNIDKDNEENLLDLVDDVLDFSEKYFIKSPQSYSDLIYNEIIETTILIKVSEFLNDEYYRLK